MAKATETTPKTPLTAQEKAAAILGKFNKRVETAQADPRVVAEKTVGARVDAILSNTVSDLQAVYGESFEHTSDTEAVAKLLASLNRVTPSAKKAIRSLSDAQLQALTTDATPVDPEAPDFL